MSDPREGVTRNRGRRDVSRVDPDLSNAVADTIALWLAQHAERSPRNGQPIKNCPLIAEALLDVIIRMLEHGQPGNLEQVIMGADFVRWSFDRKLAQALDEGLGNVKH
jgi:hypothetical protein